MIKPSIVCDHGNLARQCPVCEAKAEIARLDQANASLWKALGYAEAALADIGDAEREPGDSLEWCARRAAEALPAVRQALSHYA
jgi:hypothetical protein